MKKIWSYIELMQKKLVWAIPTFMIMGIIYGTLFNPTNLKSLVMPLTFLMVYPIMVTLKINIIAENSEIIIRLQSIRTVK